MKSDWCLTHAQSFYCVQAWLFPFWQSFTWKMKGGHDSNESSYRLVGFELLTLIWGAWLFIQARCFILFVNESKCWPYLLYLLKYHLVVQRTCLYIEPVFYAQCWWLYRSFSDSQCISFDIFLMHAQKWWVSKTVAYVWYDMDLHKVKYIIWCWYEESKVCDMLLLQVRGLTFIYWHDCTSSSSKHTREGT